MGLDRRDLHTMEASDSLRIALALGGLALAVGLERAWPYRRLSRSEGNGGPRSRRHLALWMIAATLLYAIPFATAVGAAEAARRAEFGLLNQFAVPSWVAILLSVAALDAWTWTMHRLYHRVPALWRLHRVHHSDDLLSATTGVFFHPGEVLVSAFSRLPVVALLGASVPGVVAFEIALLVASQIQHADVRLPDRWARILGSVFVTPNLHRTHHSVERRDADSNFGTISSIWDRSFGTLHVVEPERVVVGSPDAAPGPRDTPLGRLLALPFQRNP